MQYPSTKTKIKLGGLTSVNESCCTPYTMFRMLLIVKLKPHTMKKTLFAFVAIILAAIALTSFRPNLAAPKLYPELEAYFKTIDAKQFDKAHINALENLKSNISFSSMDYLDYNIIFYCSENSFRSQVSQVFLQTLCFARKHKKVKAFSAGLIANEIDSKLIIYLSKIGYKISKTDKDGKSAYEVRYSDNANPIILYSKTITDPSLPKKEVAAVIVCDVQVETDCSNLKTEFTPLYMAFPKVIATDSDTKVEEIVNNIATEMLYVTQK